MKIHTAKKNHRCNECGRLIPVGVRYWRDYKTDELGDCEKDAKSHTNCLDYREQPTVDLNEVQKMNSSRNKSKAG
jgi:hypothetical protein